MHLEVFDDQEWVDRVAQRWVSYMEAHPPARICLPTGETPRPVYTRAVPDIDLSHATVFLLDEFDLPPGSPGRCDSMLQRDLLESLKEPPRAFHRFDVGAPEPVNECARYDALVGDGGLDLTLLGLGGNGHLGLNEPGTSADSPTRLVDLTEETTKAAARYDARALPTRGMTLGLERILGSREIWLLVSGVHKASTLSRMMEEPIGPNLPATFLRDHSNSTVLADRSAAARVS